MDRQPPVIGSWGLQANPLHYLPLDVTIHHGSEGDLAFPQHHTLDYLRAEEIPAAYQLLQMAAERGDNVGADEFPAEGDFRWLLRGAEAFSVKAGGGGGGGRGRHTDRPPAALLGVLLVAPCRLARGLLPRVAEIIVILSPEISRGAALASALETLVPVCETIARDIGIGYTACVVQIASILTDWYEQLRGLGYHVTACLPKCILVRGEGFFGCIVMHKVIAEAPSKDWAMEELLSLPKVTCNSVTKEEYDASEVIGLQIPFLPVVHTFEGNTFVIRNLAKGEDSALFDLFAEAAKEGMGYSQEEFATLDYFRKVWLQPNYALLIEEQTTEKFGGFIIIRPRVFVRSHSTPTCTFAGIAAPAFRGRQKVTGGSGLTLRAAEIVAYHLGYRYLLSTLLCFQTSAIRISNVNDYYMTGVLPNGIKIKGRGWVDMAFLSREIRSNLSQEEIAHKL